MGRFFYPPPARRAAPPFALAAAALAVMMPGCKCSFELGNPTGDAAVVATAALPRSGTRKPTRSADRAPTPRSFEVEKEASSRDRSPPPEPEPDPPAPTSTSRPASVSDLPPPPGALSPWAVISRETVEKRLRKVWTFEGSEGSPRSGGWGTHRIFEIGAESITIIHAPWEREERSYTVDAPCRIRHKTRPGTATTFTYFAVGKDVGFNSTPVGYRDGKRAVVCTSLNAVLTFDGTDCWWWQRDFTWKPRDGHPTCSWEKDRLVVEWKKSFMDKLETERMSLETYGGSLLVESRELRSIEAMGRKPPVSMRRYPDVAAAEKALCGARKDGCSRPK